MRFSKYFSQHFFEQTISSTQKYADGFCYLRVITDLYSRKVVGHSVHALLSVKGCMDALKQALRNRKHKTARLCTIATEGYNTAVMRM